MKKIVYLICTFFILNSVLFAKEKIDFELMIQKETRSSLFSESIDGIDFNGDTFNFGYEYRFGFFETNNFGFYTDFLLHQLLVPSDSFTGFFLGSGIGVNYKNNSDKQLNGFSAHFIHYMIGIFTEQKRT